MANKKKEFLIMTALGPVPYEIIKDHINPLFKRIIEKHKDKLTREFNDPTNISYYINSFANRKGWSVELAEKFINSLSGINKSLAFSLLLREVAIELDKKYEDHIEDSEEIYCISTSNGHIFKADKKFIKNYRNFAAFRTMEDAKTAAKILRGYLRDMFKSGK